MFFFSPIWLLFLFPNVLGNNWFMNVGEDRYISKDMRSCLFGEMNNTHYDLQHIAVPNVINDERSNELKYGCGIDATECARGKLEFGIYQSKKNIIWFKLEDLKDKNYGLSNDVYLTKGFGRGFTALKDITDTDTLNCVINMLKKTEKPKRISSNFACPLDNGTEVTVTENSYCELNLRMDDTCSPIIKQSVVEEANRKSFFERLPDGGQEINLYCSGNFCPLMPLAALPTYIQLIGNGSDPRCLQELREEIKRKQAIWDTKICETIKKHRSNKIMENKKWDELLNIYECNPSSSTTVYPITTTNQVTTLKPTNEINSDSSISEVLQETSTAKEVTIINKDIETVEEESRTVVIRNSNEDTTMNAVIDSTNIKMSAKEHPVSQQTIGETFSTEGIILMIFTWIGIILTSCIFVYVLCKFDPATMIE